ncbi:MAG: hypothetical protein QXW38_08435 [Candidatus Nitrosotenuis sp.]
MPSLPQGIDIDLIREALQRRAAAGVPRPNAGLPALGQVSAPGQPLPTGGPNTPTTTPPQVPTLGAPTVNVPPRQTAGLRGVGQAATSPAFDEETRGIAKALVRKLLQYI